MPECYKLLSKPIEYKFGPCRWAADESIPLSDRILQKGSSSGLTIVEEPQDAAQIYADFLAENEHGEDYSAHLVAPHVTNENLIVFQMQPGTPSPGGGHYLLEPQFFAVLVTNDED